MTEVGKTKALSVLDDFGKYCQEVRGDWNDFDGRDLLRIWTETAKILREYILNSDDQSDDCICHYDIPH
jgi:hypothetical protein